MAEVELKYTEIEKRGINTSMIKSCKKLRQLAKLNRLRLDDSEHRTGLNKHLFEYIQYCGLDVLTFIRQYLSNIQPYMIERRKDQEKVKSFLCVIDNLYRISVYIKVDSQQYEELVISFHEDNKRGVARSNTLIKKNTQRYIPVFADSILSKIENENKYVIKVLAQRGLKVLPIELPAVKCQDIFIVEENQINLQFLSYCNDYIKDLYTSDLELDYDKIEVFSMLQQISFTSYGNDTFSSISLLIDSFCIQSDSISRQVADFALVTFVQNLRLTTEQQNELKYLLRQKYMVSDIKKIDIILQRVEENLSLSYNNELDELAEQANEVYIKIQNENETT